MRKVLLLVVLAVSFCFITSAFASMKTLEFPDGKEVKVMFDGKMHNDKLGKKCAECHKANNPFPMKKPGAEGSAKITMADMKEGKFCGTCHNGKRVFDANDKANCEKCHKK